MRCRILVQTALFGLLAACSRGRTAEAELSQVAEPATRGVVDSYHGTLVADPYRWLEGENSPETRAWIEAQNERTAEFLDDISGRDRIRDRLEDLWNFERYGIPAQRGGRYFYGRNDGLQDQSVLCVAESLEAEPRVLIDPNVLSEDGTVALAGRWPSPDGKLLAYALSLAGSDWREFFVRDVESGVDLSADHLRWIKFSDAAWLPDSSGFYYVRLPEPAAGAEGTAVSEGPRICFHRIGTPQAEDQVVYERPDQPKWGLFPAVTDDGRYLILYVSDRASKNNGVFFKDLQQDGPVVEVLNAFDATYWPIDNEGSVFTVVTDLDAPMRRIVAIDVANPAREEWRDLVPEARYAIDDVVVAGERIVVNYLRRAQSRIEVFRLDGAPDRVLQLPRPGSVYFPRDGGPRRTDNELFFAFSGFVDPPTIYRFDFADGALRVLKRADVQCDPDRFVTKQVAYNSLDGTAVTMFIAHRKGLELDGNRPVLLYGYGGFGSSETPWFSVTNLVWMELGGVLAIPNLRGGGEYGEAWHEAGMRENKQNVFDDFIAAAERLIENNYTSPRRIAIHGSSNGGLLVGACVTQRPDLFGAALPDVGVMDMLRYQLFTIGYAWVPEYGSSDDPEMFKVLYSYSPYHNLKPGTKYPATLITTADHDDRVVPLHSFKFAARMQECQAGDAPILIRIETKAGHGAGTPTRKRIEEATDRLAFLTEVLDMKVRRRFWKKD